MFEKTLHKANARRTHRAYVLILACVCVFISCESDAPTQHDDVIPLWPLEVGRVWERQVTEWDQNGDQTASYIDSIVVTGLVQMEHESWYTVSYPNGISGLPDLLITNRRSGVYGWSKTQTGDQEVIYLYPGGLGQVVQVASVPIKMFAHAEKLTIQDTTYTVWGYQALLDAYSQARYTYMSPGVGPVLEDWYLTTNDGFSYLMRRCELIRRNE